MTASEARRFSIGIVTPGVLEEAMRGTEMLEEKVSTETENVCNVSKKMKKLKQELSRARKE